MVLEFCNGGDVMEKMSLVHVFKEAEAKHIVKQLIAGICCFHAMNIVHRDLKLDNLMYNNGVLKIIDFGLAGDCTDNPLNTPCGTIHFTAPEVLQSYDYGLPADMWSVGMLLLFTLKSLYILYMISIKSLCFIFDINRSNHLFVNLWISTIF